MDETARRVKIASVLLVCFVLTVAAEVAASVLSWGLEAWTDEQRA